MRPILQSAPPRPAHPDDLTPDERRRELAAILAEGVRRLHARAALPCPTSAPTPILVPQNLLDSEYDCESGFVVSSND